MARYNEPVNILIVDDLATQRLTVEAALAEVGERIVSVNSGREALKFLLENDAAVVLLDVNMPDMDGFETTRAIREHPEFRSLPIIAVTAKAMKGDREKCIEAGASDYLAKPVDPEELVAKLRDWLFR